MAIRNRVIVLKQAAATTAAQSSDTEMFQIRMPSAGRLRSVTVNAGSCAGTSTRTFRVLKSATGAADDTFANSTVAMTPAIALADTPVSVTALANSDESTASFIAGTILYVAYITGSGTTSTNTTFTIVYDA